MELSLYLKYLARFATAKGLRGSSSALFGGYVTVLSSPSVAQSKSILVCYRNKLYSCINIWGKVEVQMNGDLR